MFIALSLNDPIVSKYLNNFAALAPVAYIDNQQSTLISVTNNYFVKKAL